MRVKSIKKVIPGQLYDIGIEKNHNFFADFILVHNCHRFSKTQQDVLLPFVEEGHLIMIGATISNPYHAIDSALISRSHVFTLEPLELKDLYKVLLRGIEYYRNKDKDFAKEVSITPKAAEYIVRMSCGDARKVLSILELVVELAGDAEIDEEVVKVAIPSKYLVLGDTNHFDFASAMQGAVQASDPDAAVYWLAKWLESGEDPRYIARRIVISASEDSFNNPFAAVIAHSAYMAACEIGRPECDIVLSHAVITIAISKRDKSAALAIWSAVKDVREGEDIQVPKELRDGHYPGAEKLGHGAYQDGINQQFYVGINKKYFSGEHPSQI